MLIIIIRIILVWWLLSAVFRFIDRYMAEHRSSKGVQGGAETTNTSGAGNGLDSIDQYAGAIEDADFEEIDSR